MPVYSEDTPLLVPYSEKDEAKALGARWNAKEKYWYIPAGKEASGLARWLPKNMGDDSEEEIDESIYDDGSGDSPSIYLVVGQRECFKCGNPTKVIGFGIPYSSGDDGQIDSLTLYPRINRMPKELADWLEHTFNYKKRYSNVTGVSQSNNCCQHCDVLQGEYFLFHEVEPPFWINSYDDCKQLEFYELALSRKAALGIADDDELDSWSSADKMLFQAATRHAKKLNIS